MILLSTQHVTKHVTCQNKLRWDVIWSQKSNVLENISTFHQPLNVGRKILSIKGRFRRWLVLQNNLKSFTLTKQLSKIKHLFITPYPRFLKKTSIPDSVRNLWYIKYCRLSSTRGLELAPEALNILTILSAITVKRLAIEREMKQTFLRIT